MTDDRAAFRATIHGLRTVPSRKVIQLILECPIEQQAEIARIAEHGAWVAVARINPEQEREAMPVERKRISGTTETPPRSDSNPKPVGAEKRPWNELAPAQQAGILCGEPAFWTFLNEKYDHMLPDVRDATRAAIVVREICGVTSRRDIATDTRARGAFYSLNEQYRAWKLEPEVIG